MLTIAAIEGLPEVRPGDDLAALIANAAGPLGDGDVLAIAHKIVSKAEGRIRGLADVQPATRAIELARAARQGRSRTSRSSSTSRARSSAPPAACSSA